MTVEIAGYAAMGLLLTVVVWGLFLLCVAVFGGKRK
jgi:hypothetical protein